MTNFDFLLEEKKFSGFANTAITAEKLYQIDLPSCLFNVRRALEFAVKWMYSVDGSLTMPYQDQLVSLINTEEFRDIIDDNLYRRINFIRMLGNNSAHSTKQITPEQAQLALENLFYFLDFVAYCYADKYSQHTYDKTLLTQSQEPVKEEPEVNIDLEALMKENAALKAELTQKRQEQQQTYSPKPLDLSEYKTRKIYIDTMLQDAGWVEGKDWFNEYPLPGMPNHSEIGYADYVLFDDTHRPLAVIEAKRACKDVAVGRQQAKLYADLLEKKFGRRPIIFLTNGFDTRIWNDKYYPEHRVSGFYSKRDLEKEFNKLTMRTSLAHVQVSDAISGRYYQKEAIKAVCRAFDEQNRRKALLVMATGSGKTRTVISIVDVLLRHGWVKNVLFLADRNSLVTQAKRAFVNLLPNLTVTNLCEEKDKLTARGVFSTYQTMMNCIDDAKDENGGKLFTVGHFDLIICDEAHRSIYNKYKDIFNYFDAHLVGLTATPRDEIDKNTYGIFELENGVPTYGYELAQAVQDGYLVDFVSIETKLKFIEEGIAYDDLSDEDKEEYEALFANEDDELPDEAINSNRQISFQYFQYNVRKEQQLKHNGEPYVITPLHLVWNGDYYYMIGVYAYKQRIGNFRVDRIAKRPKILDAEGTPAPEGFNIDEYINTTFKMFNSEHAEVELVCDNEVMDSIIDKFGAEVTTYANDMTSFRAVVNVAVNHVFLSWVFGFGGKVKIKSPEAVREKYSAMVRNAFEEITNAE